MAPLSIDGEKQSDLEPTNIVLLLETGQNYMVHSISSFLVLISDAPTPQDQGQFTTALSFFLKATHASTSRSSSSLRLRSLCAVATCRMFVSPTPEEAQRGFEELDEVWGEILAMGETDLELLAIGNETRGRALVIMAKGDGKFRSTRGSTRTDEDDGADDMIVKAIPFWKEAHDRTLSTRDCLPLLTSSPQAIRRWKCRRNPFGLSRLSLDSTITSPSRACLRSRRSHRGSRAALPPNSSTSSSSGSPLQYEQRRRRERGRESRR